MLFPFPPAHHLTRSLKLTCSLRPALQLLLRVRSAMPQQLRLPPSSRDSLELGHSAMAVMLVKLLPQALQSFLQASGACFCSAWSLQHLFHHLSGIVACGLCPWLSSLSSSAACFLQHTRNLSLAGNLTLPSFESQKWSPPWPCLTIWPFLWRRRKRMIYKPFPHGIKTSC